MKKLIPLLLSAMFLFSGCSFGTISVDELMRPPKPVGENGKIQEALEKKLGTDITLKYPKTGEYRTAYVECNIDGDYENEVIVFYKKNAEVSGIRFNIIDKVGDDWVSAGDSEGEGTDVDKVIIADLNNDGINEIVIGWNTVSTKDKNVSIYSYTPGLGYESCIGKRFSEMYTVMEIMDFMGDGTQQIMTVLLNTAMTTSSASLLKLDESGVTLVGKVSLDGNVSSYSNIIKGKINNSINAIYLDGYKGANVLITEIVYYNGTALTAPLYDEMEKSTTITLRETATLSMDIDSDGNIEIPLPVVLPGYEQMAPADQMRMSNWYIFTGKGLEKKLSTVNNINDGYYFMLPPAWVGNVTVIKSNADRSMTFFEWTKGRTDIKADAPGRELMKIKVYPETEASKAYSDGFVKISSKNGLLYTYKLANEPGQFEIKSDTVIGGFIII